MQLGSIFYLKDCDEACNFAHNNKLSIVEIERDLQGRRFQIVNKIQLTQEEKLDDLRTLREEECFPIINRGNLWYESLTLEQKLELKNWYQNWLDVTVTQVIPTKPTWLN